MERKSVIIVAIVAIFLLAMIIFMVSADFKDDTIMEVNGIKYSEADFKKYVKVSQYENGESTEVSIDDAANGFASYMLYKKLAESAGVKLTADEEAKLPEDSGEVLKMQEDYNLSAEDYLEVNNYRNLANKFVEDLPTYYSADDAIYDEYKEELNEQSEIGDLFKTYTFYIVEATLAEYSGDEADEPSGEKEIRKNNAKSEAAMLLARIESGDEIYENESGDRMIRSKDGSNETLLPEVSNFISTSTGWNMFANGAEITNSGYQLFHNQEMVSQGQSFSFNPTLDNAIMQYVPFLAEGENSEILELSGSYGFIHMVKVEDGLNDTDMSTFQTQAIMDHINHNISLLPTYGKLQNMDIADFIPIIKQKREEAKIQEELEANSEENNEENDEVISATVDENQDSGEIVKIGESTLKVIDEDEYSVSGTFDIPGLTE